MAVNMMQAPNIWPGEEQPSLLDQDSSMSSQAAVTMPRPPVVGEEIHNSSPACTRPPRSKSKGELVIVINENLKNSKQLKFDLILMQWVGGGWVMQLLSQLVQGKVRSHCVNELLGE